MWENRNNYNGIAILPYNGACYEQMPFEECTKEKYEELIDKLRDIDLSKVPYGYDNTQHTMEAACAAGQCSL